MGLPVCSFARPRPQLTAASFPGPFPWLGGGEKALGTRLNCLPSCSSDSLLLFIFLFICLSCLSCLSVRLSVCLSVDWFTMLFSTFRILIEVPSSFRADQYSVLTGSKDCSMKIWSLSSGKLSTDQTFVADNFLSLRCSFTTLKVCGETLGFIST